jgi:uncharacterized protein (TIGR04141 family)
LLRIYLIEKSINQDDEILRDKRSLKQKSLKKSVGFEGRLYYRDPRSSEPAWTEFLRPNVHGGLDPLRNTSTDAVLLLKVKGQFVALVFGHGRSLLIPDSWEMDFGLKVTLNSVNPDELKSIDCRTPEDITLQTRRQVSKSTSLDAGQSRSTAVFRFNDHVERSQNAPLTIALCGNTVS